MKKKKNREEELMDYAECMLRLRGYDRFNFRDLAETAKIKSASVHYHFATKEQLATAVAKRYARRMNARLGEMGEQDSNPANQLRAFLDLNRGLASSDEQVCLFVVLGTQMQQLPEVLRAEVIAYFTAATNWLSRVMRRLGHPSALALRRAQLIIAALDGAMVAARVFNDPKIYDKIVAELENANIIPKSPGKKRKKKSASPS